MFISEEWEEKEKQVSTWDLIIKIPAFQDEIPHGFNCLENHCKFLKWE